MARPGLILIAGLALSAIARSSPADAQEARVLITKADCSRLVKYSARPDVVYQPGVDARGRAVVPADLDAAPGLPSKGHFIVTLEVDLAERLGIPSDPSNFDADVEMGLVEVRDDRAYLNGRPLQDDGQAVLAVKCREAGNRSAADPAG